MSHEQNVGNPEKLITTAVAIGLSAAALTGCGIGDYEASSAETPNPAAIAEQEAVDWSANTENIPRNSMDRRLSA